MASSLTLVIRFCIVATLFAFTLRGADINLPFEDGNITIRNPLLLGRSDLSFVLENHTSKSFDGIDLEFKIGGFCNGEPRQVSYAVHEGYFPPITSKAHGGSFSQEAADCKWVILRARIALALICPGIICAPSQERRIEGVPNESFDLEPELRAIQTERLNQEVAAFRAVKEQAAAKAAAEAEQAAAEAKQAVAEMERQRKLERNQIAPPFGWQSWPIAPSCRDALDIFGFRGNESSVTIRSRPNWPIFTGQVPVRVERREGDCALVDAVEEDSTAVSGWVAEALLLKLTAEQEKRAKLATERKKVQEKLAAEYRAEQGAKAAMERETVRSACQLVYNKTVDKKVGDLTVRETQQVQACQVSGLYPPR